MGILTAVLITPTKVVATFQTHDSTLAIMHRARLALCPVGVSDCFLAQPVPLPSLGTPTHADPQVLQAVIIGLDNFVIDMFLMLSLWEADQLQIVVFAVLQGFSPAICHFSNFYNLWRQETTPEICFGETKTN